MPGHLLKMWFVLCFSLYSIRATNCCNLQRNIVALEVEKRCCAYYHHSNIVTQQNFVVASWRSMLQQVELASTFFNKYFQLATTKFCCVTVFEVGGNTCNNASQLATQWCCIASWRKMLPVLPGLKLVLNIFSSAFFWDVHVCWILIKGLNKK